VKAPQPCSSTRDIDAGGPIAVLEAKIEKELQRSKS
jgi:hypothetical protein